MPVCPIVYIKGPVDFKLNRRLFTERFRTGKNGGTEPEQRLVALSCLPYRVLGEQGEIRAFRVERVVRVANTNQA